MELIKCKMCGLVTKASHSYEGRCKMCANCKDNLYYLECKRCKTVSINYRDIIYEGKKFYEIFTCGLCGAETKREGCVND